MQVNLGKWGGALGMLWIDLETTGTSETSDDIIEIGAIYTDFDLMPISEFDIVIEPNEYSLGRMMKDEVVRNMYTANGLLMDCIRDSNRSRSIEDAESKLIKWLNITVNAKRTKGPVDKFRFVLAGSGVAHFDRRFIREQMPNLDNLLVFSPYDVGQVRRGIQLAGIDPSTWAPPLGEKNHRALDDIRQHLAEAQCYRDKLQEFDRLSAQPVNAQ